MTAEDPPRLARLRRWAAGVRFRTTVVAVMAVAVVLVVSVVIIALQIRGRLESSIASSAETRAADVAALAEAGPVDDPLPGRGSDLVAQIVDPTGMVVAASPGFADVGPFAAVQVPPGQQRRLEVEQILEDRQEATAGVEDEGPYRIVARGASSADGPVTVLVAASLEPARRALDVLWPLLLIALPIILAAVGLVIWALTGRALRPVEAMREQAAAISAAELERRLPVPPSHDEVHRLAMTLNDMLDRLEAAALRQQRFVADASHELKSPVAAMRTMLDVAERDPHFADWHTLLADLGREDRRLERLIGDLLTLARSDEHALAFRRAEVDLDQIVGREAEAAGRGGGRVDTTAVRPMRVLGDPDALARLFRNLLDNATRFAANSVWVESEVADGEAVVWISDDGPGIPATAREHVFERFVRLDESRDRRAGGTGLGLALARAVAVAHGGKIAVIEPRHGGATIEVRLPAELRDPAG